MAEQKTKNKLGNTAAINANATLNDEMKVRLPYVRPQILSQEKLESIAVDCQKDTTNAGACGLNINS